MVAFIEAGAPVSGGGAAVEGARLLAPLRPRTLRDFLAFEGHLKNAFRNLGRDIPPGVVRGTGLLQGHARHRRRARGGGRRGRRTATNSTTSSSSPP